MASTPPPNKNKGTAWIVLVFILAIAVGGNFTYKRYQVMDLALRTGHADDVPARWY